MADKTCCVPGCGKPRSDNLSLHSFPNPENDVDRFRTWLYKIGGEILSQDNNKIYKYRKICDNHFEMKYRTRSKRLTVNAVPTLHMPDIFVKEREPMKDLTNQSCINLEPAIHNVPTTSTFSASVKATKPEIQQPKTAGHQRQSKLPAKIVSTETNNLVKVIRKLQASKDNYSRRLKKALDLSKNESFQKALKKFSAFALIFTLLQFREINKKKMGRRFSKKEKIMALALYKRGPKAYRWLRHIFVLPSPLTLSRLISRAALKAGINANIFENLMKRVKKMNRTDKLCTLMFDEIAIAPHFDYNRKRDEIVGFVNNGTTKVKKIADHALVFMIRGIVKNYKQPIAYTFCAGSTDKNELVQQIKTIIRKLKQTGLNVVATVCDQGASNKSAITYLINETRAKYLRKNVEWHKNTFEVDGNEIIPLFDAPHLIKGIRNNLLNKNLTYVKNGEQKTAKWEHILNLYKEDPAYLGLRMLPTLTEQHVIPNKIKKMKVKYATQIFSKSVAIAMGYLAGLGVLPEDSTATAELLIFFDDLFDSVNGSFVNSQKKNGKALLRSVTPNSCHFKVWTEAKIILKSMKYVTNDGRFCVVPSITNWIITLENLEYLTKKLFRTQNCKSIWLRHFNQDPLENFFGCIRSHGVRNTNPTSAGFESAFAALLVNNMNSLHSVGFNCENDSCYMFKSLGQLFFRTKQTDCAPVEIEYSHLNMDHILLDFKSKVANAKIKAQIEYVTGYVVKKLRKIFKKCKVCNACFLNKSNKSDYCYLKMKDYSTQKNFLTYPTEQAMKCFSEQQDMITYVIKEKITSNQLKNYIMTVLSVNCSYNFIKCVEHKNIVIEQMQDLLSRFFLCTWCKDTNRLLKGTRQDFEKEDDVQKMAHLYFLKHNKK